MKIYWIRHAEAEGNLYRRCQGQYDSLVTENGKEQLKALKKRFNNVKIDAVYSSDLYRAWATANAIAKPRNLTVITHKGLREINLGPWEDVTWIETHSSWSAEGEAFTLRPWEFVLEGAETIDNIVKRCMSALMEILEHHNPGDAIVIVSHGMTTRAMMTHFSGLRMDEMNALPHGDNTSVSVLNYENNRVTLDSYADNSHLGELSTLARQNWWRKDSSLTDYGFWFRTPDFNTETNRVEAYRRDAWLSIYGDLGNYDSELFIKEALRQQALHPEAVVFAMDKDTIAGIIQLDLDADLMPNSGHISFNYLEPQYRGKGLGVQLIGHAASLYRKLGRSHVVLRVAETNEHAVYFYKKCGFVPFGQEDGYKCSLLLLALDISIPPMEPSKQWV
jgi:probable phosphoglycerate mutase